MFPCPLRGASGNLHTREALQQLAFLRTHSKISALIPDDVLEETVEISKHIKLMSAGGSAHMILKSPSPFWLQVQSRLQWFFKYLLDKPAEDEPAGLHVLAPREARGTKGLERCLEDLKSDTASGTSWDLKVLQSMKPWADTFHKDTIDMLDQAVRLAVGKAGRKLSFAPCKAIGDGAAMSIEDADDDQLAVVASSSAASSSSEGAKALVPINKDTDKNKMSKPEKARADLRLKVLRSLQGK